MHAAYTHIYTQLHRHKTKRIVINYYKLNMNNILVLTLFLLGFQSEIFRYIEVGWFAL